MTPIGMGLAFLSYVGGLWGYCLVRGYNVTLADMFKSSWPAGGGTSVASSTQSQLGAPGVSLPSVQPVGNATGSFPTITPQGIQPGAGTTLA